jgi:hypothetical protein
MTSQINFGAITTSYPVAGEDNDSQGFRDNFTAIAAGLAVAKTELTQLQNSSVLRADLATNTTAVQNDLNGSTIANAFYNKFYGVYFNGGTQSAAADINLANGPLQKFTLAGDATLTFKGWPASGWAKIQVVLEGNTPYDSVRHPTFATTAGGTIKYDTAFPTIPGTSEQGIRVGGESLASITIENQGSGYTTAKTVTFSGISGSFIPTATATYIVKTAGLGLTGVPGTGYKIGDRVAVNENPNVILSVAGISGGGSTGPITSFNIVAGTLLPAPFLGAKSVSALTGTGTGATVELTCGIDSIKITDAGDGFLTTPPNLVINSLSKTEAISAGNSNAYGVSILTQNTRDNVKMIEASSFNGGVTVYLRYLGEF